MFVRGGWGGIFDRLIGMDISSPRRLSLRIPRQSVTVNLVLFFRQERADKHGDDNHCRRWYSTNEAQQEWVPAFRCRHAHETAKYHERCAGCETIYEVVAVVAGRGLDQYPRDDIRYHNNDE